MTDSPMNETNLHPTQGYKDIYDIFRGLKILHNRLSEKTSGVREPSQALNEILFLDKLK